MTENKSVKRVLYMPDDGAPIDNLIPVYKGFYGYRASGEKQVAKHVLRVYTDAMYMVRNMINQFETLEASVGALPEAGVFMGQKLGTLKKMLRSIEKQHKHINEKLFDINRTLEERRAKIKIKTIPSI